MISSIGGGMLNMAAMQSIRQQAFTKADASGNGALDVGEFKNLIAQGPGGKGPPGMQDAESTFKAADSDGDGELTSKELQAGMEKTMQAFQSTMARANQDQASQAASSSQDSWKTLLDSLQQNQRQNGASLAAARAYSNGGGGHAHAGNSLSVNA